MSRFRRSWILFSQLARTAAKRMAGMGPPEPPDHAEFTRAMKDLAAAAPNGSVRTVSTFDIPATQPPWTDTGIDLGVHDQTSLFVVGQVFMSRALDIWFSASNTFWFRIGEHGEARKASCPSLTVRTEVPGRLYVCGLFSGSWADTTGTLATPIENYEKGDGRISVGAIHWAQDAEAMLAEVAGGDPSNPGVELAARELEHIQACPETPPGWKHFWELGYSEIYQQKSGANGPLMCCHSHGNSGILQKDVDRPLTPSTRVRWKWKVDQLPSRRAEDTLPTHDYLSVAFEFENGRDLSYYWSSKLPVNMSFDCPMPGWENRETHLVVRSGTESLGQCFSEERNLFDDYVKAIGAPPSRIVRAWFIAVSSFQRGEGRCEYSELFIEDGDQSFAVLEDSP